MDGLEFIKRIVIAVAPVLTEYAFQHEIEDTAQWVADIAYDIAEKASDNLTGQ